MIPTARNIPPTQPSADFSPTQPPAAWQPLTRDALYPGRGPSNSLYLHLREWPRLLFTARIERGPSDSPTSPEGVGRLFFTARIERPPLFRGGSASKKNGLPAPSHSSEAARCASTGIVPATPPLFQHPTSVHRWDGGDVYEESCWRIVGDCGNRVAHDTRCRNGWSVR
jgi:hypothetical protein